MWSHLLSAKEIGAPDAFVADMSGEQMSKEVKAFCNDIGITLRALEDSMVQQS